MRVSYNQLPLLRDTYVCTLYTQTFSPSSQSLTPPIRKGPKLAAPSIGARAASALFGGFLFFFTLGGFWVAAAVAVMALVGRDKM